MVGFYKCMVDDIFLQTAMHPTELPGSTTNDVWQLCARVARAGACSLLKSKTRNKL
jgi:hypothetical protein